MTQTADGTGAAPRYASPVDYETHGPYGPGRDTTDFASYRGLADGPKPTFLHAAPWRIDVEPRLADWDAPPGRDHLG
jgi:hypothetical protein